MMKHKFLLSVLTAIVFLAATTSAEAGIFGRLSVVWNGCNPCVPVACMPCEPVVVCNPCDMVACDPCAPLCGPFVRPFRPFGGLFANMGARLAAARCVPMSCDPCVAVACDPCAAVVCNPCDAVACDPCAPLCGPICGPTVRLPFNGFFMNLRSRLAVRAAACHVACDPCAMVACDPCAMVACDPCAVPRFRW